ncbi:hypothetical protein [Streptomyces sp. NEAU-W12]|uniref:hypothetical protein n=1 Tax=Streptomyces sp. NEAU-W12 TaxID=2994668 RepID=UPI00224A9E37|nr:hypothetical protein [Streptomyces sp. NEAU-W12]MCX2924832.1 hypothetical protein [Streptomyces sp. NEAU-W12]
MRCTGGPAERRRGDIGTGLFRLCEALRRHRTRDPQSPADTVPPAPPPGGAGDGSALIVVRL